MRFARLVALMASVAVVVTATIAQPAAAQTYPAKPIRMIVSFSPGGTSDFVGRIVAAKLGEVLGQPVVVENRPGAAGLIGTQVAAQAAPDGYTILLAPSDFTITPGLQRKPAFDPIHDFAPVGMVIDYPHILVASPQLPASTPQELIALAKAKPGELNYASGGLGSSNHVSGEWFKYTAGVDITHVPYKGNGPAITDLLANRVQLLFTSMGPVEQFLKEGKLKAIAVTGPKRLASAPDIPTLSESALPGYDFTTWYGLAVPAGTPRPIIDRLNAALRQTMASPEVKDKLASIGGDLTVGSPEEFGARLAREMAKWKKLVKDTGLKID